MNLPLSSTQRSQANLQPSANGWVTGAPTVGSSPANDAALLALQQSQADLEEQIAAANTRIDDLPSNGGPTDLTTVNSRLTALEQDTGFDPTSINQAITAQAQQIGQLEINKASTTSVATLSGSLQQNDIKDTAQDAKFVERPLIRAFFLYDNFANLVNAGHHAPNTYAITISNNYRLISNGTDTWTQTSQDIITLAANNNVIVLGNVDAFTGTAYLASHAGKNMRYGLIGDEVV